MKQNVLKIAVLFLAVLLLAACSAEPAETTTEPSALPTTIQTEPTTTPTTEPTTAPTTVPTTPPTEPPEPVVFFPDAPEAYAVCALPKDADVSDLVTPYWQKCVKMASNTHYISIPAIFPFSQEAIDCQQEIYRLFKDALWAHLTSAAKALDGHYFVTDETLDEKITEFKDYSPRFYHAYEASYESGILTVLVRIDDIHGINTAFHTFKLAVPSGTVDRELFEDPHMGVDDETIRNSLEVYYKEMHAALDSKLDFYQENLKKTLSDENIAACTLLCDTEGKTVIIATIYTVGSVDRVTKAVPLLEQP